MKLTIHFTPNETSYFRTVSREAYPELPNKETLQLDYWITAKGGCCYPKDMCNRHLENTLKMLQAMFELVHTNMLLEFSVPCLNGEHAQDVMWEEFDQILCTPWEDIADRYKIFRTL